MCWFQLPSSLFFVLSRGDPTPPSEPLDLASLQDQRRQHLVVLRRKLQEVEAKQTKLEQRGVEIEKQLRSKEDIELDDR